MRWRLAGEKTAIAASFGKCGFLTRVSAIVSSVRLALAVFSSALFTTALTITVTRCDLPYFTPSKGHLMPRAKPVKVPAKPKAKRISQKALAPKPITAQIQPASVPPAVALERGPRTLHAVAALPPPRGQPPIMPKKALRIPIAMKVK